MFRLIHVITLRWRTLTRDIQPPRRVDGNVTMFLEVQKANTISWGKPASNLVVVVVERWGMEKREAAVGRSDTGAGHLLRTHVVEVVVVVAAAAATTWVGEIGFCLAEKKRTTKRTYPALTTAWRPSQMKPRREISGVEARTVACLLIRPLRALLLLLCLARGRCRRAQPRATAANKLAADMTQSGGGTACVGVLLRGRRNVPEPPESSAVEERQQVEDHRSSVALRAREMVEAAVVEAIILVAEHTAEGPWVGQEDGGCCRRRRMGTGGGADTMPHVCLLSMRPLGEVRTAGTVECHVKEAGGTGGTTGRRWKWLSFGNVSPSKRLTG